MTKLTFSQTIDGFILDKQAASKSANTIRNYRVTFSKVALWMQTRDNPDPTFADLTRQDWVEFMAWLQNDYVSDCAGIAKREPRPLSQKSLLNIHTDLCALYTWATSPGVELVSTHILHTIERPEADAPLIESFTRDQVQDMLKACKQTRTWVNNENVVTTRHTADRDQCIVYLLLSTGIRASELCAIRFKDIKMNDRSITVAGKGRGQGKKQRLVHFGKSTARALWRYISPRLKELKPDDIIFLAGPDDAPRPMTRDRLLKIVNAIGDRASVAAYPHKFRHTFATNYLRNGGDLLTLKALLGHSSLEMVQRYAQIVSTDCAREHEKADPVDNWKL